MTLFIKAFSIWLVLYSLIIIFKSDYLIHVKSIKSKSSLFWIGVVQLFFSVILFLYSYENSTNYSLVIIAFAILSFLKSISLILETHVFVAELYMNTFVPNLTFIVVL